MSNLTVVTGLIAALGVISGIILGWSGRSQSIRKDLREEAGAGAVLHTDVEYIKRGVDDIKVEIRVQGQKIDTLAERVTRVEESAKQAHKRLDRFESTKEE